MALAINHVHVKTRDPKQTMQFYVDNLGATREQHYGLEHIAVDTDDYPGTIARFRANGVRVLEELSGSSGRRVGFLEAPDGAQIEVIEKV